MERKGIRTLNQFRPGDTGKVIGVTGGGALKRRILEMGLVPGAKIRVKGVAPLGDPIEVVVKGYSLTLRRGEAEAVAVEVD